MLSRAWFVLRVNGTLAGVGVDPKSFDDGFRANVITLGYEEGLTPHEVVTFLVLQLPIGHWPDGFRQQARQWVHAGKVDPKRRREFLQFA